MLKKVRSEVEAVMKGPPRQVSLPAASLAAVSRVYAAAVDLRYRLYRSGRLVSTRLPCVVVSVGNIAVGGTGKTPFTIFVAEMLQQAGIRTAILTRGYGGKAEKTGGVVSDGKQVLMGPDIAGDEPFMMAMKLPGIPVLVGRSRAESGTMACQRFDPQVILLDDGFQHRALKRDFDIVLLDHGAPLGNGHVIPRGILREHPRGLQRADMLVMTRCMHATNNTLPRRFLSASKAPPVFHTTYAARAYKSGSPADIFQHPQHRMADETENPVLHGKQVFAFSGIADHRSFTDTVRNLGCTVLKSVEFPDHHSYSEKDLETIYDRFKTSGADTLLTTEKDYVKFYSRIAWKDELYIMGVRVSFLSQENRFQEILYGAVSENAYATPTQKTGRQNK